MNAGVNVYFDEYDNTLDLTDPHSVVNSIKNGLTCIIHSQSNQKQPRHPRHIGYSWDKAALPGFIIVGCENWVY